MSVTNHQQPPASLSPGTEVELCITKLAFGGKALGRVDGFVVFVDHALPGQKLRVRITRKKDRFAEAALVELLEQSPAYEAPFCPHFGCCGGCPWQDLAYGEQLRWKGVHVEECLQHLAGIRPGVILPTVPAPQDRYYRNKMEFTFSPRPWLPAGEPESKGRGPGGRCALGLHVGASFDRIFNLEDCYLQSPRTPAMVQEVRRWCADSGLPAYNPQNQRGFWRFLVLREGKRTSQTMVHLITTKQGQPETVAALGAHLQARFPGLTTMVHSRNDQKAQIAAGGASRTLWGPGYIEEQLGQLRLRISAHSFLQTNTLAAEGLYDAVARMGGFTGKETVWDLYCGIGSIGLSLAPQVRRVVGFELVSEAVADAVLNSRANGLDNCRFVAGDLQHSLQAALRSPRRSLPDLVIADPPRAGLQPPVVQALLELAPPRIIYVSCHPATLARDLGLLQGGYEITTIQPFDLFPHTAHVEVVACLERRQVSSQ